VVAFARQLTFLPEAFLYGFSFVMFFSAERGAFLAGQYSSTGWWWFFPFAFLFKSTLGELLAAAAITVKGVAIARKLKQIELKRIWESPLLPLALFAIVFGIVTLTSRLNIGQRHILPLYLILFIMSGALFAKASCKYFKAVGFFAIALSAAATLRNQPHPLAYFNILAGGSENGWKLLVDSSLDWGQDVAPLGRWVKAHREPGELVYVSTFGTADPEYEGIEGQMLAPYYSLGKPRKWYELQAGLYCVSATMLQDVYGVRPGLWSQTQEKDFQFLKTAARINLRSGEWQDSIPELGFHPEHPLWLLDRLRFARLCQYLKVRKPEAVINHTQFVFRLTPAEIEIFSNQPFSALVELMHSTSREPEPQEVHR
jgi:hypothetical protein